MTKEGYLIRSGVNRPGAITRAVNGLTTKVLNERLSDLLNFDREGWRGNLAISNRGVGIVNKVSYPEIPPRVEYEFTEFGLRFIEILDTIDELEEFRHTQSSLIN